MRWRFEALFEVDAEALFAAALDPETLRSAPAHMRLVASATRVECRELGEGRLLVVDRYEPAFEPPPFARGVRREMLGWDLHLTWDLTARAAGFVVDPHVPPEWKRYARAQGTYSIEPRGVDRAARVVEGVLDIRVPVVGALAERFAVHALRDQFEGESRLLASSVRRRKATAVP